MRSNVIVAVQIQTAEGAAKMAKKKQQQENQAPSLGMRVLPETLREQVGVQVLAYIETTLGFDLTDPYSPVYGDNADAEAADAEAIDRAITEEWKKLFEAMRGDAHDVWQNYDADDNFATLGKLLTACLRAEELGKQMYDTWGDVSAKGVVDVFPKGHVQKVKRGEKRQYIDATEQALGWGRVGIHLIWTLAKQGIYLQDIWPSEIKELREDTLTLHSETEPYQWLSGVIQIVQAICNVKDTLDPLTGYSITSLGIPETRDEVIEWLQHAGQGAAAAQKLAETEEQLLVAQNSLLSAKASLDRGTEGINAAAAQILELEADNEALYSTVGRLEKRLKELEPPAAAAPPPGYAGKLQDLERRNQELEQQAVDLLARQKHAAPGGGAGQQDTAYLLAFIRELANNTGYAHPELTDDLTASKAAIEAIRQKMQDI